ncbi:nucleoside deaminase [Arthrobacter sp. CJ23]|uniref:nucleoside deaminase n=1 Tax=Arthrobacter sp. CJ23 TaxID=2972479 RepID=UPI00215C1CCD|nr:nucleoside deaminase [Arthrobacter sp. CJ23]UVJ39373.1 nucleoside deaminase [Arthrobacter sp. CJ23]
MTAFDAALPSGAGAEVTSADIEQLQRAIALAWLARERGDHPFGALLLAADGTVVEAMNTVNTEHDPTGHAETNLVRLSAKQLDAEALAGSTLYTSTEPCAMCTGAIYWAGIGRVVYALPEQDLAAIVTEQSGVPTMDLPCREVFARGGRPVAVAGPAALPEAAEVHAGFWL